MKMLNKFFSIGGLKNGQSQIDTPLISLSGYIDYTLIGINYILS